MDHLLAWQNVIFYIPLAVGLLLVFGSAFGGAEGDNDADGDHDADNDHDGDAKGAGHLDGPAHDHDHEASFFMKALSLLGVGRVPLTVVLMMSSLLFGGFGIVLNMILSSIGIPVWIYGPVSIVTAFIAMVALTGRAARILNRLMPTTESYHVSRHDLVGCTGTLLLPADETASVTAQVKDHEGNVHNVMCRTTKGTLPKGGQILLIDFDPDRNEYLVDVNPVASNGQSV